MQRYLLRRLGLALPVLLGISIVTFTFSELAPGDAVSALVLSQLDQTEDLQLDMEALRAKYGLDKSPPERYLRWLQSIFTGNLGKRIISREDVSVAIGRRLPATLQLMVTSSVIALVGGISLGIFSAIKQYSWADYLFTTFVFIGISIPNFFAAIAVLYLFGVNLRWLPTSGYSTITLTDLSFFASLFDRLKYLIMPAGVLAIEGMASYMRYTRASMLEVLRADYVTTARSKGLREKLLIFRHVFRNAILPLITIAGLHVPGLFGGALIIETIFDWPGLGRLYLEGVASRDYTLIMGMVLISAVLIVVSNLLADVAYAVADPRIRYE
jgi:peptide/nickel transport system permease protein